LNRPARELERTVRRMANSYNRDASDRASDVSDVHYYAHVSIETESRPVEPRVPCREGKGLRYVTASRLEQMSG
jgi:hypothetical protein